MSIKKTIILLISGFVSGFTFFLQAQTSPFISFDVEPGTGCSIVIQWKVFPEMDTSKYEVEKSRDKQNWTTIASKTVRSSHQYFFIDPEPGDSLNYYRVKQSVDRAIYSEVKWVQVNTITDVFIWPNPARNILRAKTPFISGSIDMTDAGGRLIRKIIITDFITEINTESLAKGIYFLSIRSGDRLLTEKFIKE